MILLTALACREPSAEERFREEVAPILERRCADSACHGVDPGSSARGEVLQPGAWLLDTDASGTLRDLTDAREATLRVINTEEAPIFSSLVRVPLSRDLGGGPHSGGESFLALDDPELQAICDWIDAEDEGGEDPEPLNEEEAAFAAGAQPALLSMGCGTAACHGPDAAIPFRLHTGIAGTTSIAETRANHTAVHTMLALWGRPEASRLLRKALPLHDGGIPHRGGNDFLTGWDDGRTAALWDLACQERQGQVPGDCEAEVESLVYLRNGALMLASLQYGEVVDTRALGPTGVKDLAVSLDGARVAWAGVGGLRSMDLASGEITVLTEDPRDFDPTFLPRERLWFASTREGGLTDDGATDSELYELDLDSLEVRRRTWTPHPERDPVYLDIGEEAGGEVAFTAERRAIPSQAVTHPFRMPPGLATEYHQHFGVSVPEGQLWGMRELADGRYVLLLGERGDTSGAIGILDRNTGPELDFGDAAIPAYIPPLRRIEDPGPWKDPAGLPNGDFVASRFNGADWGIVISTPEGEWITLLDEPGVQEEDPEPVFIRPERDEPSPSWDPDASTALLLHGGLPMIEAILDHLAPRGSRAAREDIVAVRLVEALPWASSGLQTIAQRVLGELELEADGSFQVEIPAGIAFRMEALDDRGMTVGTPHNRWYDAAPGQTLRLGLPAVPDAIYTQRCAACHGALDGDPDHVFEAPDLITSASRTLARFEGGDPRQPREAPTLGDATRLTVDWEQDVEPIFAEQCGACHAPPDEEWVRQRLDPDGLARRSAVVEWVLGEELDAPDALPANVHGTFTEQQLLTLVRWIETGAAERL